MKYRWCDIFTAGYIVAYKYDPALPISAAASSIRIAVKRWDINHKSLTGSILI
jgi:hypothetical protein